MKALAGIALSLLVALSSARPAAAEALWGVAIMNNNPPFQFSDPKSGEVIGFEIDLIKEFAKRIKFAWATRDHSDAHELLSDLENNPILDAGIGTLWQRKMFANTFEFSDPYLRSDIFMLVRGDEDRFHDVASFNGSKARLLGVWTDARYQYVAAFAIFGGDEQSPRKRSYDTVDQSVKALIAGEVDAVLVDGLVGAAYAQALKGAVVVAGHPLDSRDYVIYHKKGSIFAKVINKAIAAFKRDGTLDALKKKWFVDYKIGQ